MTAKKDQEEELRKLRALLEDNKEASGVFDSLPGVHGEEEEPICGLDAAFPSTIEEIFGAQRVSKSENGSKAIKAISKLIFRK